MTPILQASHEHKNVSGNNTSKRVHWSQYADEISFFTIQDVVRLSNSLDDDYFSDEEGENERRKHENEARVSPDLQSDGTISPSPPLTPSGKTRFVHLNETDSISSDDSNFYEDPKYVEVKKLSPRKKMHTMNSKPPKMERHTDLNVKKKEKTKKWIEDSDLYKPSLNPGRLLGRDERPTLPPKSTNFVANGDDNDSEEDDQISNSRTHNSWVSPQICLSKRNDSTSRGDYAKIPKPHIEPKRSFKQYDRPPCEERRRTKSFSEYLYEPRIRPNLEARMVSILIHLP